MTGQADQDRCGIAADLRAADGRLLLVLTCERLPHDDPMHATDVAVVTDRSARAHVITWRETPSGH